LNVYKTKADDDDDDGVHADVVTTTPTTTEKFYTECATNYMHFHDFHFHSHDV
jgi:hypothetical protein